MITSWQNYLSNYHRDRNVRNHLSAPTDCNQGGKLDFNVMVISIIKSDIYKDNDLQNEPITDILLAVVNPACPDLLPLLFCSKGR